MTIERQDYMKMFTKYTYTLNTPQYNPKYHSRFLRNKKIYNISTIKVTSWFIWMDFWYRIRMAQEQF